MVSNEQMDANKKGDIKVVMKNMLDKSLNGFRNGKYVTLVIVLIFLATLGLAVWMFLKAYFDVKNLNERGQELNNLKNYNTSVLNSNSSIKNEIADLKTLDELIEYNIKLDGMDLSFKEYLEGIQSSYDNFLKYLLLPSLNIWKDPFLGEIDASLIGEKYLEKNPYNDIDLINKWSDFVKDVGSNNERNTVTEVELLGGQEEGDEFYMSIKISYVAPSHRSLLLLLEKFATTSNQRNISLINEFVYNIWDIIKSEESDEVISLQEMYTGFSQDKAIGFILYNWVKGERETSLINDQVIDKAIRNVAICGDEESVEYCYYKFRDKYRSLPTLAYSVGLESNADKTNLLRDFFRDLTQIIKVIDFTYDGEEVKDLTNYVQKQYKGTINFRIYGDTVTADEVLEIQQLLGSMCLGVDLTPESALKQINSKLTSIGKDTSIDTYTTVRLVEIESLITEIANSFGSLGNYKKAVKTFEMYRMLSEGNVCNL